MVNELHFYNLNCNLSGKHLTTFPLLMKMRNILLYENDCNKATDMGVYLTDHSVENLTANLPEFSIKYSRCVLVTFSVSNPQYDTQICMNYYTHFKCVKRYLN